MWSVRYKIVNRREGDTTSTCRVCKQETAKTYLTEKKITSIFWLIPIAFKLEYVEICAGCHVRVRVITHRDLIDC